MKHTQGTAVITGGSSGIGAGFAKEFAKQGYDLLLIARDHKKMEKVVADLQKKFPVHIQSILADIGDMTQLATIQQTIQKITNLRILVNCAGFGIDKEFVDEESESRTQMIQVHNIATVKLCHQAIKKMQTQKNGIIVNVGSLAGFFAIGNNPIYAASKAFLNNFSQNLYRKYKEDGIYIQSLCPGFTKTHFADRGGFQYNGKMGTVEDVVASSIQCFHKQYLCIPGRTNKLMVYIYHIMPRQMSYTINKQLARYMSK